MSRTGSCLCRAVTYSIASEVKETGACHCKMCRRWSGGVFLGVEVQPDQIAFEGDVQSYRSSAWAERVFCPKCGTSLWYRIVAPGPHNGVYHVGFGTLDDQKEVEMTGEIFIDIKPDAYSFAGERKTMTEAEVMAMFGPD